MSHSGSSSKSKTKTYPRLALVVMQFRRLVRRCGVNTSDEYIEKLCNALRQGWVQTVSIYGMDSANLSHVEVSLQVDWNEHNRQLSRGVVTVSVDEDVWRDDLAIEIDEMIILFVEARDRDSLSVEWRITLSDRVTSNQTLKEQVYRELNLVDSAAIRWASSDIESDSMSIQELSELTARIRYGR